MSVKGAESGYGILELSGNAEIHGNIGETDSLSHVAISHGETKFFGNIIAADSYISVDGEGTLQLTENTAITTDYLSAANNTKLNIEENSHNITGSLRMISGSSLVTSVSTANGVNSHGKITANGDTSIIQSGVKLRINALSGISAVSSNLLFENLYETPENISQIADGNIYINEKHTNSIGNFLFKTEVVDGSLKLNITQLTQSLDIYAADGDEFNYSQGNPNENDVTTSIREVTEVNLMDAGATLSMGSGVLTRKVNLAEGSVLNTGSGEIIAEIAAKDGRYQGTVNIKNNLELVANIGAANRELAKISIQNNSLLGLENNSILAQEIEIISGDLGIRDGRAIVAAEVIAQDYAETARTNIRLSAGGRLTLDIYKNSEDDGLNNSIHANVSGATNGVGVVNITQNFKSDYLAIGSQSNKVGELVIEDADVVLGSSIYSAYIEVGDGEYSASLSTAGSIQANQIEVGNQGSSLSADGSIKVAAPIDGDEDTQNYGIIVGEESTLVAKEWIYKNYTVEDILENTKITLKNSATLQTYGNESVLAATIDGNSTGRGSLKIGDETVQGDQIATATTTNLYGSIGEENALEEIIVGVDANLRAAPNAAEYPDPINISAQTITLKRGAELTASGRLSAGPNESESYNNVTINLYNDSVLTLNSGAAIFGGINGVHQGQEEQSEAVGRGTLAFANSAQPTNFTLSGNIGDITRISSMSVGRNVEIEARSISVYTDSLSLAQDSNLLAGNLHSSNVTINTKNIEKGLIATDSIYTALAMSSSINSSLTITSGKVTGVGNYLLGVNTDVGSETNIIVGQNALGENDAAAILSNTGSGSNIVYLTNSESIELAVENKATGTISTNGGTLFHLAQGQNADSTFSLTNAGTITKNSGEASAIVSNYATTINNSGTITGSLVLNPSRRAANLTNSGTINGNIEISSSSAYNSGSNSGGSSITMEEGGVVNGNITMNNAGTRVVGNGGRINGNFTMNNADQSVYFNGLTLNGDILGVSSAIVVQNATFVKESTIIETESFTTFSDSSLNLTLSSPSTTPLQIIGAATLAASTTLNLTISGDIADDEYYTLITATEGLSGGNIADNLIKINNGQNLYNGKSFSVSVIENQLRLIGVSAATPEIETQFSGAKNIFNEIVANNKS